MKLNLKQTFKNLKGEDVKVENETLTLGIILANIVLAPHKDKNGFRPLKSWELGKKLYENDIIELDMSDFIQIKELVENHENYFPFILGQVLEMLIKAEK